MESRGQPLTVDEARRQRQFLVETDPTLPRDDESASSSSSHYKSFVNEYILSLALSLSKSIPRLRRS